MNKIEEIKKKIRDLKLKQKMTTGRLEWNEYTERNRHFE
mgnify:CR=1 FL=1